MITAPASIAWLFNIRGGDVIRSPLPLGQAILERRRLGAAVPRPGQGDRRTCRPGSATRCGWRRPDDLPAGAGRAEGPAACWSIRRSPRPGTSRRWRGAGAEVVRGADPCALPRACKNAVEIEGTRRAHVRDGAALTRFLHWVATEAPDQPCPTRSRSVAKLEGFREATGALKDLSFDTIAGAGLQRRHRPLPADRSGSTSAPSRARCCWSIPAPSTWTAPPTSPAPSPSASRAAEMRERFTLVLKGHLALARVRFPAGTTGSALDALARAPLWAAGLDYDHGTGHGVGSYLGVHEGPQRIAKLPNTVALRPGMIVSNEPGYYKEGAYGIRIENLQVVTAAAPIAGGERPMLGFETLTLAPIDRRADRHGAADRRGDAPSSTPTTPGCWR